MMFFCLDKSRFCKFGASSTKGYLQKNTANSFFILIFAF